MASTAVHPHSCRLNGMFSTTAQTTTSSCARDGVDSAGVLPDSIHTEAPKKGHALGKHDSINSTVGQVAQCLWGGPEMLDVPEEYPLIFRDCQHLDI